MQQTIEPSLGSGIYTLPEAANILKIPKTKLANWVNRKFVQALPEFYGSEYVWVDGKNKTFPFQTLMELSVIYELSKQKLSLTKIIQAHKELGKWFNDPFPFCHKDALNNLKSDSIGLYFTIPNKDDIVSLDGKKQYNIDVVRHYFKNMDFADAKTAQRYFPLGQDRQVVVDPKRQFGAPTVLGTGIKTQTVINLHNAGETTEMIAELYDITEQQVKDVVEYYKVD